jgi:hypothetical protein
MDVLHGEFGVHFDFPNWSVVEEGLTDFPSLLVDAS